MKDVLVIGSEQSRPAKPVASVLLSIAVRLRSRRMDAGKVGFTVLAPAGPGFSSRQVALKLSAALEQIQDGPVLTVHCEPEEQPTSTPSELFVVTPAQELSFRGLATPYVWRGGQLPLERARHPVTLVTFGDAVAYCAWLSQRLGVTVRLPDNTRRLR